MTDDDAQERALSLLEEALQKAEMLLTSSTHDQLLVRSLLHDLTRLKTQLDGLRLSGVPRKVPDDEFWPVVSLIFSKIAELLVEKLFK